MEEKKDAARAPVRDMGFIPTEENHVGAAQRAYDGCVWAKKPDPVPEEEIAETQETEVLIIGGGIAGLARRSCRRWPDSTTPRQPGTPAAPGSTIRIPYTEAFP